MTCKQKTILFRRVLTITDKKSHRLLQQWLSAFAEQIISDGVSPAKRY
jgi:hypothetical protein